MVFTCGFHGGIFDGGNREIFKRKVMASYKKHLKHGIKLVIDGDANPVTIVIRASKAQLYRVLDVLIPDEE